MIKTANQGKAGVRNRNTHPPTRVHIIFLKKDRNEITHTASSEVVVADGPDGAVGFELCAKLPCQQHSLYIWHNWGISALKRCLLRCQPRIFQKRLWRMGRM
jgi:hypothetical protein